jgi:hypothetical protein
LYPDLYFSDATAQHYKWCPQLRYAAVSSFPRCAGCSLVRRGGEEKKEEEIKKEKKEEKGKTNKRKRQERKKIEEKKK